jgi:signal transduction histidine kinase
MSILARLILLTLLALVPALAVQAVNIADLRREREAELRLAALHGAELRNSEIAGLVEGIRELLIAVARLPAVRSFDPMACDDALAALAKEYPEDIALSAIGINGIYFCSSRPLTRAVWAGDLAFFRQAIERGQFTMSGFSESRLTGDRTMHFGYPIRDEGGDVVGVLAASLLLDRLAARFAQPPLPQGWSLTMSDREGIVLVHVPDHERWVGRRLPETQLRMIGEPMPGVVESTDLERRPVLYGFVPPTVPPKDLYILFGVDRQAAFTAIETATWRSVALSLVSVLLALVIAWLVGVRFIRAPVQRLVAAARGWQNGDYAARTGLATHSSEIGELARAFDKMAEKLQLREQQLEAANRTKDVVLASAGHDLRQPLQIVTMAISVLARKPLNESERRHIERADLALDRLTSAFDTLIEASRLRSGVERPHRQNFALSGLIRELRDEWTPRAQEKGLRLRVRDCAAQVSSDPQMLRRILHNLVGNAVKYTEKGGVLVAFRRRPASILIEVYDTGIGIPEAQIESIFNGFKQLDPIREGFGLGLWIAQSSAAALGHEISVRSQSGQGSRFRVEVPLAGRGAPPPPLEGEGEGSDHVRPAD